MEIENNQLPELSYLDFELQIEEGSGPEYRVRVRSVAGDANETMRFPFDSLTLVNRLLTLQNVLLRSVETRRRLPSDDEKAIQQFGKALFDALFIGEVRTRYAVCQREANQQGKGLRLKLRFRPPQLAALPWEFMYDPEQAEYICLSKYTPLVRYVELSRPLEPLLVKPPIRVLGMITRPLGLVALDIEQEKQRIEKATRSLRAKGLLQVTWLQGETWQDLQWAMRRDIWHIFHFVGHGGFDDITANRAGKPL